MGDHAVAAGGSRVRRGEFEGRRRACARRRIRLQPEQVQPRHAGVAPAGIELQAVHLLRVARAGFHAEHADQRRTHLDRPGADRRPGVGAEELRRQVRGPVAAAAGPRQVEEPRVDPDPAGDRPGLCARLGDPLRIRRRQTPGLPDDGARRGFRDAVADAERLWRLRQRRVPREPVPHHQGDRQQRQDADGRQASGGGRRSQSHARRAQRVRDGQPA